MLCPHCGQPMERAPTYDYAEPDGTIRAVFECQACGAMDMAPQVMVTSPSVVLRLRRKRAA